MSILGLCLIVAGTVFSFFGTYSSDKEGQKELTDKIEEKNKTIDNINLSNSKLIDQNATLLASSQEVSASNNDLISQNSEMLSKVSKYQTDIEKRNLKIQVLEDEIKNFKDYSFYSKLDIYGREFSFGDGLSSGQSELTKIMSKIFITANGKQSVIVNNKTMTLVNEVINKYPNFPFGHLAKFNIQYARKNPKWKESAEKAKRIFEITTSIEGHNPSHDSCLAEINRYLNK